MWLLFGGIIKHFGLECISYTENTQPQNAVNYLEESVSCQTDTQ